MVNTTDSFTSVLPPSSVVGGRSRFSAYFYGSSILMSLESLLLFSIRRMLVVVVRSTMFRFSACSTHIFFSDLQSLASGKHESVTQDRKVQDEKSATSIFLVQYTVNYCNGTKISCYSLSKSNDELKPDSGTTSEANKNVINACEVQQVIEIPWHLLKLDVLDWTPIIIGERIRETKRRNRNKDD